MAARRHLVFHNGFKMPSIGMGTSGIVDEHELETALSTAIEAGYRHIDTAYVYQNEVLIGKVLKRLFQVGKINRENLFITTKLPSIGMHPDRVELFLKRSLANLQLDYVDLYLIHGPKALQYDPVTGGRRINHKGEAIPEKVLDLPAVWKKMEEQVHKGGTKSIGVSNFNIDQLNEILLNCRIKPANLQVEMHIFLQQPKLRVFCRENSITIVAYSPFGAPNYNQRRRQRHGPEYYFLWDSKLTQNVFEYIIDFSTPEVRMPDMLGNDAVEAIAEKYSKTPAQILLRFLLEIGVAAIPKSVRPERIKENFQVYDFSLDSEDLKKLTFLDLGEEGRIFKKYIT